MEAFEAFAANQTHHALPADENNVKNRSLSARRWIISCHTQIPIRQEFRMKTIRQAVSAIGPHSRSISWVVRSEFLMIQFGFDAHVVEKSGGGFQFVGFPDLTGTAASGPATPISPPSAPAQRLFQEPPSQSKFLAASHRWKSAAQCVVCVGCILNQPICSVRLSASSS